MNVALVFFNTFFDLFLSHSIRCCRQEEGLFLAKRKNVSFQYWFLAKINNFFFHMSFLFIIFFPQHTLPRARRRPKVPSTSSAPPARPPMLASRRCATSLSALSEPPATLRTRCFLEHYFILLIVLF